MADGQEATGFVAGLGPESEAEAERLNARALAIAEASARGDSGPLAEAFGDRVPPGELKARNEKIRQESEARLGPFKGVRVMGTVPAQAPQRPAPDDGAGRVRYRGRPRVRARHGLHPVRLGAGRGSSGATLDLPPPATEFRPVSESRFASYSLATGSGTEIAFELDPSGRVTGLSFGIGAMRTIAKRVG